MFFGKIHLLSSITPDPKRVKAAMMAAGWRTEKSPSIAKATRHVDCPSIILIEDKGDAISELFTFMEKQGQYRCVCAFSETSDPYDAVKAMRLGVTDYFRFSLRDDDLRDRLERAWEIGSANAARRTEQVRAVKAMTNLSKREAEVLEHYRQGLSTEDISNHLGISKRTIEIHRSNIRKGLDCESFYVALRLAEQARM